MVGQTLAEYVNSELSAKGAKGETDRRLERALRKIEELLEILSRLDKEEIHHLDLSPDNVLIRSDGPLQIIDWGKNHVLTDVVPRGGAGRRAEAFVAPELASREHFDEGLTDAYGVGLIAAETLSGVRLDIEGLGVALDRIHTEYPTVARVVDSAVEKNPKLRLPERPANSSPLDYLRDELAYEQKVHNFAWRPWLEWPMLVAEGSMKLSVSALREGWARFKTARDSGRGDEDKRGAILFGSALLPFYNGRTIHGLLRQTSRGWPLLVIRRHSYGTRSWPYVFGSGDEVLPEHIQCAVLPNTEPFGELILRSTSGWFAVPVLVVIIEPTLWPFSAGIGIQLITANNFFMFHEARKAFLYSNCVLERKFEIPDVKASLADFGRWRFATAGSGVLMVILGVLHRTGNVDELWPYAIFAMTANIYVATATCGTRAPLVRRGLRRIRWDYLRAVNVKQRTELVTSET